MSFLKEGFGSVVKTFIVGDSPSGLKLTRSLQKRITAIDFSFFGGALPSSNSFFVARSNVNQIDTITDSADTTLYQTYDIVFKTNFTGNQKTFYFGEIGIEFSSTQSVIIVALPPVGVTGIIQLNVVGSYFELDNPFKNLR